MEINDVLNSLNENPHFELLSDEKDFRQDFEKKLEILLLEHEEDNEVLKEESFYYILPAIAAYETLKKYSKAPFEDFKNMWLHGARMGAEYMQAEAAKSQEFLQSWCSNIVPKNSDAGAFVFDIITAQKDEAEYHVKSCPYVTICRENDCPELIPVFCDSDDITFGSIHPSLKWGRTKTIGYGADCCDFKFTYSGV